MNSSTMQCRLYNQLYSNVAVIMYVVITIILHSLTMISGLPWTVIIVGISLLNERDINVTFCDYEAIFCQSYIPTPYGDNDTLNSSVTISADWKGGEVQLDVLKLVSRFSLEFNSIVVTTHTYMVDVYKCSRNECRLAANVETEFSFRRCRSVENGSEWMFGPECLPCHCQSGMKCHSVSGVCPAGECVENFHGNSCSECVHGKYGLRCDKDCNPDCLAIGKCVLKHDKCLCQPGYEGVACSSPCSTQTYGANCEISCGRCKKTKYPRKCNVIDGHCDCLPGYMPPDCLKRCRGFYGQDCRFKCGNCNNSVPCNHKTGMCRKGCEIGSFGDKCPPCPFGKYGKDCLSPCHCFKGHVCNVKTGNCGRYGCRFSWEDSSCDKRLKCSPHAWGKTCMPCGACAKCDKRSGVCEDPRCAFNFVGSRCDECEIGMYGRGCGYTCGHCLVGVTCEQVTGLCQYGLCAPGYIGNKCQQACRDGLWGNECTKQCPENCFDRLQCSHVNGTCYTGCKFGYEGDKCDTVIICKNATKYGLLCDVSCYNCYNNTCAITNGRCAHGCIAGFTGRFCDTPCRSGTYGRDCARFCGRCAEWNDCDVITGRCQIGCMGYYVPPYCRTCPEGFFGPTCDMICGHCKGELICNKYTGRCPRGCAENFVGYFCDKRNKTALIELELDIKSDNFLEFS